MVEFKVVRVRDLISRVDALPAIRHCLRRQSIVGAPPVEAPQESSTPHSTPLAPYDFSLPDTRAAWQLLQLSNPEGRAMSWSGETGPRSILPPHLDPYGILKVTGLST